MVTVILEDGSGALWVGTDSGLNLLNPSDGSFTGYRREADDPSSLSDNTIMSLTEVQDGTLWIGTGTIACNLALYPYHMKQLLNARGNGLEKAEVFAGDVFRENAG